MTVSRRDVLKLGVFGAVALGLPLERLGSANPITQPRLAQSLLPAPFTIPFAVPPVLAPYRTDADADYYKLYMRPFQAEIVPGIQTPMWGYNGTYPGPTIHATRGRQTIMRQVNKLPAVHPTLGYTPWTSVHLHGSPSEPQYDGYTSDVTNPGQYKDYIYPNTCSARTLWYHDHGAQHTAENVQMGLAAMYRIDDPLEASLPLPRGPYDLPLVVGDAMLAADGTLLIDNHDESGMYGDLILVNGRPWPVLRVARRKYRFRVLNACPSRSFRFFLDSGDPVTMIATDGGLMQAPVRTASWRHGMAERYEIVIDFAKYPVGRRVVLGNVSPSNNINYPNTDKVMAFDVVGDAFGKSNNRVPDVLNPGNPAMALTAGQAVRSRRFDLVREHGQWTINGHTWADVVASGFTRVEANPREGDVELWEIRNLSGGWFHPFHIHLVDFKILDRNGRAPFGYERGPKDVAYVGENESVRLLIRFEGRGKYMMHCHNLVHEDHDMMSQFEIRSDEPVYGPLDNPCQSLPEQEL